MNTSDAAVKWHFVEVKFEVASLFSKQLRNDLQVTKQNSFRNKMRYFGFAIESV